MKAQRIKLLACVVLSNLFLGCNISQKGEQVTDNKSGATKGGDASASTGPVIQPQKQSEPGQILKVTVDDEGKLLDVLVLRLDYFPAPRVDGVSVPSCYDKIAAHLVVGRLSCGENGNITVDVVADQVIQQCNTASPPIVLPARLPPPVLAGCKGPASLLVTRYSPDIKLEIRP